MKYAPVVIGFIVLLLFVGIAYTFMHNGVITTPATALSYAPYNYQASVINSGYQGYQQNPPGVPVTQGMVVNAGYPYPGPQGTYGTVPVMPVVWYTSPNQPYYYNTTRTNVVYPQQYGSAQILPYTTGSTNYQYTYQYQNQYPSQGTTGVWYNNPSY